MALNLAKALLGYLKERPEEKLTARQIAEWIFATFPAECQAKKQSSQYVSTDAELVQQLIAEISSQRPRLQKRHPELKTTEGQPRKYYYGATRADRRKKSPTQTSWGFAYGGADLRTK